MPRHRIVDDDEASLNSDSDRSSLSGGRRRDDASYGHEDKAAAFDKTEDDDVDRREGEDVAGTAAPVVVDMTAAMDDASDRGREPSKKKRKSGTKEFALKNFTEVATTAYSGGKNVTYRCNQCKTQGRNNTFVKAHVPMCIKFKDNAEALAEFDELYPGERRAKGSILQFVQTGGAETRPTPHEFRELLTKFIVRDSQPFSLVDSRAFRDFLQYVYSMGQRDVSMSIPSRRTLVDQCLLGDAGLIATLTRAALDKHKAAKNSRLGSNFLFDSARDTNKASVTVGYLETGDARSIIKAVPAGDQQQTAEYYARFVEESLRSSDAREADDSLHDDERIESRGFDDMLALTEYVWAAGSDGASNAQAALRLLEERLALVPWRCMAHNVSRVAVNLTSIMREEFLDPLESLVRFFRSSTACREALRGAASKVLIAPSGTRFLSHYIVVSRVLKVYGSIKDLLRSDAFASKLKNQPQAIRDRLEDLKELVKGDAFEMRLKFLKAILAVLLKIARLFDSASRFANCFAYSSMSAIPSNLQVVFAQPEFALEDLSVSRETYEHMAEVVVWCWDKYHMPVNGAGFVLCHIHHGKLTELVNDDCDEANALLADTVDTVVTLFRRWDPDEDRARPSALGKNDERVAAYRALVDQAVHDYAMDNGPWAGFAWDAHRQIDPETFWQLKAPRTILNKPAVRITNLGVVSSDVERAHGILKDNRTKDRNRLTYSNNAAISFAKMELMHESKPAQQRLPWSEMLSFHRNLMSLSDQEEKWVNQLEEKWAVEQQAAGAQGEAAAAAQQEAAAHAAQAPGESDVDDAQAASASASDGSTAPEQPRSDMSSRGRRRFQKTFGNDFIRFEDDT